MMGTRAERRRAEKLKVKMPEIAAAITDRLPTFNEALVYLQSVEGLLDHADFVSLFAEWSMAEAMAEISGQDYGKKGVLSFMGAAWTLGYRAGVESVEGLQETSEEVQAGETEDPADVPG